MARLKTDDAEQIPAEDVEPAKGKVLDERYFVEEYFPARVDPASGMILPESWNRNYAEVHATEKEANSWIAKHVPDYEGGKFRKAKEELREITITQWMPA